MNPSVEAFLTAASDRLAMVEDVASCAVSRGRFTEAELTSTSFKTPALRVAAAIKSATPVGDGRNLVVVRVGIAIVTRDTPAVNRETAAIRLVDRLIPLVVSNPWGLAWAATPHTIHGVNAYTATIAGSGLMVWELRFSQPLTVGTPDPLLYPREGGDV